MYFFSFLFHPGSFCHSYGLRYTYKLAQHVFTAATLETNITLDTKENAIYLSNLN